MAKKTSKTPNKEMKLKEEVKEVIAIPNTKRVEIVLNKDGKNYLVGRELAVTLIEAKRAKLA